MKVLVPELLVETNVEYQDKVPVVLTLIGNLSVAKGRESYLLVEQWALAPRP